MRKDKRTAKRQRWARLLQELADSGLSVREFARRRKLGERGLQRWITMAKRGTWVPSDYLEDEAVEVAPAEEPVSSAEEQEPTPEQPDLSSSLEVVACTPPGGEASQEAPSTILPVTLIGPPSTELAYELTFGGRQLRLPRDFEVHRVARLVRALEAGTC